MKFILSILTFFFIGFSAFGQNSLEQPLMFHISVGSSISLGASALDLEDSVYTEDRTVSPTLVIGADFLFHEKWSAGAQVGYNKINLALSEGENFFGNPIRNFETGDVNRFYAGVRFLRHFGKNEKIDWYTGMKLGYVVFSSSNVHVIDNRGSLIEANNNRSRTSLGFIPIGARFFITDQLGGHFQLSLGSPTFFSAGVNFRM